MWIHGARFRLRPWPVAAILALTLAGACSLNPQPLPPESDRSAGDDASTSFGSGSSGSSGGGLVVGLASDSGAGSSSGVNPGSPDGAAAFVEQDAALQDAALEEAGDAALGADANAGPASDGGQGAPSSDAAVDDASARDAQDSERE